VATTTSKWWKPAPAVINPTTNVSFHVLPEKDKTSISSNASINLGSQNSVRTVSNDGRDSITVTSNTLPVNNKSWWSRTVNPTTTTITVNEIPEAGPETGENKEEKVSETGLPDFDTVLNDQLKHDLEAANITITRIDLELKVHNEYQDKRVKESELLLQELKKAKLEIETLSEQLLKVDSPPIPDAKDNQLTFYHETAKTLISQLENQIKDVIDLNLQISKEPEEKNNFIKQYISKTQQLEFELAKVIEELRLKGEIRQTSNIESEMQIKTLLKENDDLLTKLTQQQNINSADRLLSQQIDAMKIDHATETKKIQLNLNNMTVLHQELEKHFTEQSGKLESAKKECEKLRITPVVDDNMLKQSQSLSAQLLKATSDLGITQKNLDGCKKEIDLLKTQIKTNKERSDGLVGSLQEQLNTLLLDKAGMERKIKAENEEKSKKEKIDIEEKFKKERIEWDVKSKKEKEASDERYKKEVVRLNIELEKLKKESDAFRVSKTEDLNKTTIKLNQQTQELNTLKNDAARINTELQGKVNELTKQLSNQKHDVAAEEKLKNELMELTSLYEAQISKHDIVVQELEVSQAAYDRISKSFSTSEETNKKFKTQNFELNQTVQISQKNILKLEKERDEMTKRYNETKSKLDQTQSALDGCAKDTNNSTAITLSKVEKLESQAEIYKNTIEELTNKCSNAEKELKIGERKSTQLVIIY
jgi:DNA repair exonuclease SbcCD ATPase subunit